MDGMQGQAQFRQADIGLGSPVTGVSGRRRSVKRACLGVLLLGAASVAGLYGYDYVESGQYLVSTDDAYVKADYTTIAPKISGYIGEVLAGDNQPVNAGQVLAHIDDRDYVTARDQAKADVAGAQAAIGNVDAEIALQAAIIAQARSNLDGMRAALDFASADASRYHDLANTGFGTVQRAQQTQSAHSQAAAQLASAQAAVTAAERKIAVLTTQRDGVIAQHDHAVAVERQAELNLSYTVVKAPVDGTVGARSLRVGQYVAAGTQLMAIVPLAAAYVVANFKETQLEQVRAGQPVEIEVDGLGSRTLRGHVDSLAPASGLEFALLPPDNATGNFTKIVQRIPVRITIDGGQSTTALRSGMSVLPIIDTKAAAH